MYKTRQITTNRFASVRPFDWVVLVVYAAYLSLYFIIVFHASANANINWLMIR